MRHVFDMLAEPVQNVLENLGFSNPTEPQTEAIPLLLKGENVLLVAPNGSGKTEAALLPILSRIVERPKTPGISALYITPLRALNRDMIKRLSLWSRKLNISVQVRHGDTETNVRRKQALNPPDMLVTTPETLQAILPGSRMQKHLAHIGWVVIDEVHELATSKRGVQLSVALERLFEVVGKDFQRIGLSATVENLEKAAAFVAGADRSIRVVNVTPIKKYEYSIEYPTPSDADYDLAQNLKTAPEAAARIRRMLELVRRHKSTLIFVNSRSNAEMLGYRFGLLTDDVAVHHGSLSREERTRIEDEFKEDASKAIVCTSTLELGIDVGQVELVIQYLSPRQVATLIQRVGRSGHRLDLVSKGVIVAAFSEDVLESFAATRMARKGRLEPFVIHENPLDVLAHQIAGILLDEQVLPEIVINDLLGVFRRTYPYRKLTKTKLLEVADYLHILRVVRLNGESLEKTSLTRAYYYRNLSMIPDEKRYPIIDVVSDRRIGTLGDEFMALRVRIGLTFICKGRVWRIVQIEDETGRVYVVPSEDQFAAIPGWDGEMLPVSLQLAKEVGRLREEIARELRRGNVESTVAKLAGKFQLERSTLVESVTEINEYLKENLPLPTHNHIFLEAFDKYVVVHMCFGEVVNRTFGSIFDSILSEHELIVGWWNDGYRIMIEMPRKVEAKTLRNISSLLFSLSSKEVDKAFSDYVQTRFPFSNRMKFVAERFGALPRGRTLSMKRMAELPSRFKKTPIYDETLREAMTEKVDISTAKRIMRDVKKRKIKVSMLVRTKSPSTLAYHIFAKHSEVAELMAPEHVVLSNIERMKKSALAKSVKLLCFSCGNLTTEKHVRGLSEKIVCGKCGVGLLAKLTRRQDPSTIRDLLNRRLRGQELTDEELEELTYARRTADLILSYGKKAIVALQTRGIGPETAFRILGRMHQNDDDFYMDLLKAKIAYFKSYPYWKKKKHKFSVLRGEKT